jgi:hypothetical protein
MPWRRYDWTRASMIRTGYQVLGALKGLSGAGEGKS